MSMGREWAIASGCRSAGSEVGVRHPEKIQGSREGNRNCIITGLLPSLGDQKLAWMPQASSGHDETTSVSSLMLPGLTAFWTSFAFPLPLRIPSSYLPMPTVYNEGQSPDHTPCFPRFSSLLWGRDLHQVQLTAAGATTNGDVEAKANETAVREEDIALKQLGFSREGTPLSSLEVSGSCPFHRDPTLNLQRRPILVWVIQATMRMRVAGTHRAKMAMTKLRSTKGSHWTVHREGVSHGDQDGGRHRTWATGLRGGGPKDEVMEDDDNKEPESMTSCRTDGGAGGDDSGSDHEEEHRVVRGSAKTREPSVDDGVPARIGTLRASSRSAVPQSKTKSKSMETAADIFPALAVLIATPLEYGTEPCSFDEESDDYD
ncbi:hypothetical protein NMY22_g12128 [Coprinellus aureogranulatus]|nr:hypothetical protein NMY22_g12128 [Coprinellus aureogranulatus]